MRQALEYRAVAAHRYPLGSSNASLIWHDRVGFSAALPGFAGWPPSLARQPPLLPCRLHWRRPYADLASSGTTIQHPDIGSDSENDGLCLLSLDGLFPAGRLAHVFPALLCPA